MAADRSVSVLITLSDLEMLDAKGQIFRRIYLITLVSIDQQNDQIRQDNTRGWANSGGQQSLRQKGAVPSLPNFGSSIIFLHTPFDAELRNLMWFHICGGCFFSLDQSRPHPRGGAPALPKAADLAKFLQCPYLAVVNIPSKNPGDTDLHQRLLLMRSPTQQKKS